MINQLSKCVFTLTNSILITNSLRNKHSDMQSAQKTDLRDYSRGRLPMSPMYVYRFYGQSGDLGIFGNQRKSNYRNSKITLKGYNSCRTF